MHKWEGFRMLPQSLNTKVKCLSLIYKQINNNNYNLILNTYIENTRWFKYDLD